MFTFSRVAHAENAGAVTAVCTVGHEGEHLVSAGVDGTLKVWVSHDAPKGQQTVARCTRVLAGHKQKRGKCKATCLTDAGGRFVISGGEDGIARLWNVVTGACLREFDARSPVRSVATVGENGSIVACGTDDGVVRLYLPPACIL